MFDCNSLCRYAIKNNSSLVLNKIHLLQVCINSPRYFLLAAQNLVQATFCYKHIVNTVQHSLFSQRETGSPSLTLKGLLLQVPQEGLETPFRALVPLLP